MLRAAAVVTPEEVETYFKKWHLRKDDGEVTAVSPVYTVKLSPGPTMFRVRVEAKDDPSDSEEKVTDEPLKFVAEFTGVGVRGASSPDGAARTIRAIAIRLRTGSIGGEEAARGLRRVSASMRLAEREVRLENAELSDEHGHDPDWRDAPKGEGPSGAPSHSRDQEEAQGRALEPLRKELRSRGWRFHDDESDAGNPCLKVDVGGEFEAVISADSVSWEYAFSVNHTDVLAKGTTDDPLREFRNFRKSDAVAKARAQREAPREQPGFEDGAKLEPAEQEATVKPGARP